jgi:hypothetical protein
MAELLKWISSTRVRPAAPTNDNGNR